MVNKLFVAKGKLKLYITTTSDKISLGTIIMLSFIPLWVVYMIN